MTIITAAPAMRNWPTKNWMLAAMAAAAVSIVTPSQRSNLILWFGPTDGANEGVKLFGEGHSEAFGTPFFFRLTLDSFAKTLVLTLQPKEFTDVLPGVVRLTFEKSDSDLYWKIEGGLRNRHIRGAGDSTQPRYHISNFVIGDSLAYVGFVHPVSKDAASNYLFVPSEYKAQVSPATIFIDAALEIEPGKTLTNPLLSRFQVGGIRSGATPEEFHSPEQQQMREYLDTASPDYDIAKLDPLRYEEVLVLSEAFFSSAQKPEDLSSVID